jgi:uridine kinase
MANKPYLIVVTGRLGSGKTTFATKLGGRLFLPVISRDEFKEGYVHTFGKRHAELPKETNKYVTELFFETIDRLLSANVSLIAEAAFTAPRMRAASEQAESEIRNLHPDLQAGR